MEEVTAAGFEAHVAEPADTQAARGRKKHAKTDRSDAKLIRELLQSDDLPESWIPPDAVLSGGNGSGSTRPCSTNGACGSSASTPSSSSTA